MGRTGRDGAFPSRGHRGCCRIGCRWFEGDRCLQIAERDGDDGGVVDDDGRWGFVRVLALRPVRGSWSCRR